MTVKFTYFNGLSNDVYFDIICILFKNVYQVLTFPIGTYDNFNQQITLLEIHVYFRFGGKSEIVLIFKWNYLFF